MILMAWMLAQAATAAPATTSASTLQAQFEQATAALTSEKWDEALAGFRAIEARPGVGARTRGVALLRQGFALGHLYRDEEARDAYRRGLALAPKSDASLADDRLEALIELGGLDRRYYDYSAARREFEEALALATDPATKLRVLRGLAAVTMFDDVQAARRMVDEALAIAAATKVTPQVDAAVHDMRGRVLLNQGDAVAALADLQIAIKDLGGLTVRTDLQDATVRSDAALAALKAKDMDRAREYLAMSGEGRLPDGPFAAPADTDLPPCGGDLRPDDVAVIEFGIGDDGHVTFADPVYASRQGPVAVEFARAVSGWSWHQNDVKSIPLFFRAITRIELRCSMAVKRPSEVMLLEPALTAWLADHKVAVVGEQEKRNVALLRAGIEQRKGDKPLERLVYLYALAGNPTVDTKEAEKALEEASAIADAEHAPPAVRALIRIRLLQPDPSISPALFATRVSEGFRRLLAIPDLADDPLSGSVIRLQLAAPGWGAPPRDAVDLLQHVADDKRLDPHDPLRVGAMVRLASIQAQHGDLAAARQTYLKTGLNAQQCALVDAQPAMRRPGVGTADYPMDALNWGIGGWTEIEFDIQPDGRTVNRRPVMAYPPFVFGEPTTKAMEATRYTQSYRPDGTIGCSGAKQRFRYIS